MSKLRSINGAYKNQFSLFFLSTITTAPKNATHTAEALTPIFALQPLDCDDVVVAAGVVVVVVAVVVVVVAVVVAAVVIVVVAAVVVVVVAVVVAAVVVVVVVVAVVVAAVVVVVVVVVDSLVFTGISSLAIIIPQTVHFLILSPFEEYVASFTTSHPPYL